MTWHCQSPGDNRTNRGHGTARPVNKEGCIHRARNKNDTALPAIVGKQQRVKMDNGMANDTSVQKSTTKESSTAASNAQMQHDQTLMTMAQKRVRCMGEKGTNLSW